MIFLYLTLLLLFPSVTQAVIITVDHVKNTKMPELLAKRFILYGDHHEHSDADAPQLEALTQALLKHDRESDEKIHILMEEPAGRTFDSSILGNLHERLQGCRTITVENIEMRCAMGAAKKLLASDTHPTQALTTDSYYSAYSECNLSELTIDDVEREITAYKSGIDRWLQTLPAPYAQAVHIFDPELQAYADSFKTLCGQLAVAPSDNVLDVATRLYEQAPYQRKRLYKTIDDLSSILFDLHISKCIMTPRDARTVMLMLGAQHTTQAYGLLRYIGNTPITRYGKTLRPIKPVELAYLDPDYQPSCFSSLCITQ